MDTQNIVRVEKGEASEEELAALTAVLLARAAEAAAAPVQGQGQGHARRHGASAARWRRLERTPGFRAPHSWQG